VAGGYFGFALMFLTRLDAAAPRDRVIRSALAIVAGIVLCIMGLLLERACKVPTEPDDEVAAGEDDLESDTRD
jgi:sulfite exporter TauE/SafE